MVYIGTDLHARRLSSLVLDEDSKIVLEGTGCGTLRDSRSSMTGEECRELAAAI